MTENEKLRALLAEAREMLVSQGVAWRGIASRIDAALAEPVREDGYPSAFAWCPGHGPLWATDEDGCCPFCGSTAIGKGAENALLIQRERDEARAEVERLREAGAWMDEVVRKAACAVAYRRGAEAMREAAAYAVEGWLQRDDIEAYDDAIRALPIPEDK